MLYAVERYVNTQIKILEPMSICKYRFKKEYQGSEVIIHGATTRSISQKNLTDEAAETLIRTRNGHVLEPNPEYVEPVPTIPPAPAPAEAVQTVTEPVAAPELPSVEPTPVPEPVKKATKPRKPKAK